MLDSRPNDSPRRASLLKLGASSQTLQEFVGGRDRNDYYRFQLKHHSRLDLSLQNSQGNADVRLLQDRDRNGRLNAKDIVAQSNRSGKRRDRLRLALDPGTYFIQVYPGSQGSKTQYALTAAADSLGIFQAKYYSNLNLSGKPTFQEYVGDGSLSFTKDWSMSAPQNTPQDGFSARLTTERTLAPGLYQVRVQADDGVRVRVGRQKVIDQWRDQASLPHSGYFYSDGKTLPITIDYYENGAQAKLAFEIKPVQPFEDATSSDQWKATLFSWDDSRSDRPALSFAQNGLKNPRAIGVINLGTNLRSDGKNGIQFNWGTNTYVGDGYRLPHDGFVMQATTTADLEGGKYKFHVQGDDGFQILAKRQGSNKVYSITPKSQWVTGKSSASELTYKLPAGQYELTVNYFEKQNTASLDLSWEKILTPPPNSNNSNNSNNPDNPDNSNNPNGPSVLWDNPLRGYPITSRYGPRTYWNGTQQVSSNHRGIDIGTGENENPPIEAARKGIVKFAETGWNGGFGNLVEIDHGDGLLTRYAHLSNIAVNVGDRVDTNTVIGYVGATGNATGNHLHFEVLVNGIDRNPEEFLSFA